MYLNREQVGEIVKAFTIVNPDHTLSDYDILVIVAEVFDVKIITCDATIDPPINNDWSIKNVIGRRISKNEE